MSIIKCPECKRRVSDKASTCPKCGFSVKDYKTNQEQINEQDIKTKARKKRVKKISIIFVAIIISLCIVLSATYIGVELWHSYQVEQEELAYKRKYPIFSKRSDILNFDPYGLSNENNIIGKQITTVLGECIENEDYTISTEEDYTVYTFPVMPLDFPIGNDVELILYTSNNIIYKIEYQYRFGANSGSYSSYRQSGISLGKDLTIYYDVDPIYCGYNFNDGEFVFMNKDEFGSLDFTDYYDVTFISWVSEKGTATLRVTNMFDEKAEYGAITFTNDEIKKEEYQDYIDKYNSAI